MAAVYGHAVMTRASAALSLSFDPRATPYAKRERELGKALAPRRLKLGLIDLVGRPSAIRAVRREGAASR